MSYNKVLMAIFSTKSLFIFFTALTIFVDRSCWLFKYWYTLRELLGLLSFCLAMRILLTHRFHLWTVTWVLLVLVIGQLWFIENMAMQIIWNIGGFAP